MGGTACNFNDDSHPSEPRVPLEGCIKILTRVRDTFYPAFRIISSSKITEYLGQSGDVEHVTRYAEKIPK